MGRGFYQNVTGKEGVIRIVALGAVIGQFTSWRLDRQKRGEDDYSDLWDFQGQLSYINPVLFADKDYVPQVFITTGRDRQTRKDRMYKLEQAEGYAPILEGRKLALPGVRLISSE